MKYKSLKHLLIIRFTFFTFFAALLLLSPYTAVAVTVRADEAATGPQPVSANSTVPMRSGKWIEVSLSAQRLNAWDDGTLVMSTAISSGVRNHPTVRGTFRIYRKYRSARMTGPGYDLPHVPYVMYFTGSFGLHGTYWHNNFGHPMSHGCVNMPTGKAAWLYAWAPSGTPVVVH